MGLDVGRGHRLTRSVDTHDQLWTKSRLRRIELDVDHSRNLTDPRFESCSFPAVGSNAAPVVCERERDRDSQHIPPNPSPDLCNKASRGRLPTCRRQQHGNREGPIFLYANTSKRPRRRSWWHRQGNPSTVPNVLTTFHGRPSIAVQNDCTGLPLRRN